MMMEDSLDQRVLRAIRNGHIWFSAIDTNARRPSDGGFRATDRVLQRLRRNGVLTFTRKTGWAVAAPANGA